MTDAEKNKCLTSCKHCIKDMSSFSPHMKCELADMRITNLDHCPLTTKSDNKNADITSERV